MANQVEGSLHPGRTKDTIITALATVLAALIGGGALVISNRNHDLVVSKQVASNAVADLEQSRQESKSLRGEVSSLQVALKKANDELARRGVAGPTPVPPDGGREQSEEGVSVALQRCSRSGTVIDCHMVVTNHQEQRRLWLWARPHSSDDSRAIDDRGQQVQADGATVAGISGANVRFDAPSNIALPAVVRFRDVPADVKRFSLLEVSFGAHRDFKVQFRDVDLGAS